MTRGAVYIPPVDYSDLDVFSETEKAKAEGSSKNPLAQRGFVHNPASASHGGVIATGGIRRDATLSLAALHLLKAGNDEGMAGFMSLVAVMDWLSRRVLSWRVSNTLDREFCVEALEEALARYGAPEIFNTDQGAQFTSEAFTACAPPLRLRPGAGRGDGQHVELPSPGT